MAKVSVGSLSTFNHEVQDWSVYKERLEQWFLANEILDTDDKAKCKRRAILLSSLTENSYKLLRDLALPQQVGTLEYDVLVKLLDGHLKTAKCGFAERNKFYSSTQKSTESMTQWAARIRGLAVDCGFAASTLDETLRDRFVLGMMAGPEREKLFTIEMDKLTLSDAVSIAERTQCARQGAAQAVPAATSTLPCPEMPVYKMAEMPRSASSGRAGGFNGGSGGASRRPQMVCAACGYEGHQAISCKFARYKCGKCGTKGHLRRVCPEKKVLRQNFVDCDVEADVGDDGKRDIFNIRSSRGEPMQVTVKVGQCNLLFEVDTGSAVTIIPDKIYDKYFHDIMLCPSHVVLQGYNGSNIPTMGTLNLPFTYDSKTADLKVYVVRGEGPCLLGRNFISQFNLEIATVNNCDVANYIGKAERDYPKLFSGGLGCCKDVSVELHLKPGSKPIFFRPRPVPFALRAKVESEIDRLVEQGILVPVSFSDYASPVVPVLKQNGSIRLCADYSVSLNKQLIIEQYPLPRIEELFARLHGGQQFSKLDLSQAYNQIMLSDSSQLLTTINTIKGMFKFTRLVFGLVSSASIFQKTLDKILHGLEGVLVFQDDILVTGRDQLEHVTRLNKVFARLEEAGLVLQKDKCMLFQESVSYLGFKIDRHGLHKCQDKIKAITTAKTPANTTELKSFLGMVNYYRNFVKDASSILSPLHNLLKKNVTWHWNEEHDLAVSTIKRELSSEKTLAHFNPDAKLYLTVDASPFGLGAILSQVGSDGIEKPVSYASRSLTSAERAYSQLQREATAIIYGVRKFHNYLYGRSVPFVLRTDNKPLMSIFSPDKGVPEVTANRLQRYAIYLMSYNFIIEYISSARNAADYLSRSATDNKPVRVDPALDAATYINFVYDGDRLVSISELGKQTLLDNVLSTVSRYVMQGWPNRVNDHLKPYMACKRELAIENSCLTRGHKIVIPTSSRNDILTELHVGHLGSNKMKAEARSRFWWPGMSADIENFVASCQICTSLRPSPPRAPLTPWKYPPHPFFRVHLDFLGPINNKMYLIVIDAYSKWPECFDVSTGYGSKVVIEKICEVMSRFGLIHTICTDNGSSFISSDFKDFCLKNSITHLTSPTYNPSSNGQVEVYVKIVKKALKSFILSGINQKTVNCKIHEFLFRYRNSEHSTTGKSPAEILFGHKLRCRLDALSTHRPASADAILESVVKGKQFSQCKYYGGKRVVDFKVNDMVLVKMYNSNKNYWAKGTIVGQLGQSLYSVKLINCNSVIKRHANQLLKLKGEESYSQNDSAPQSSFREDQQPTEMPTIVLASEQCAAPAPQPAGAPVEPVPAPVMADIEVLEDPSSGASVSQTEQTGLSVSHDGMTALTSESDHQTQSTSESAEEAADQFVSPTSSPPVEPPPPRRVRNVVNYKQYF